MTGLMQKTKCFKGRLTFLQGGDNLSVTLNVSALKRRESTSDPWQGTIVKSDAILDAGTITYDGTETYTAGTVGQELSSQRNTLNQLDSEKADEASLAYRRSGATNTGAQIENGTYFYLDGILKRAIATIASNASFTAQNCETVTAGGLNSLRDVFRNATPLGDCTTLSQLGTAIQNYYLTMPNTYCAYSVVTFKCAEAPFISTDNVFAILFKWSNDWGVGCAFSIGGSNNRITELRNRGGTWSFVMLHDV